MDERAGAAVQDRHLVRVEVDFGIVDARAAQGGEQVLGGGNPGGAHADGGGQGGIHHLLDPGGDDRLTGQVGAEEADAAVGRCRLDRQVHGAAGVQADAAAADGPFQCLLVRLDGGCHGSLSVCKGEVVSDRFLSSCPF